MKQKRRISLFLLATLILALLQPAAPAYAAPKRFTYAEQKSGATVTTLFLEPGEKVDLKFLGVSDYKKYERKWVSSNDAVATVDSNGLITARAVGNATITLNVGDGSVYTSNGVQVTVGKRTNVVLGTSSTNTFSTAELALGKKMDLGFYGMQGWDSNRYTCAWVSTNPAAATVDQYGVVTPIKAGRTFIMLLITDKFTTSSLTVTPVSLNIVEKQSIVPTATPTPKPGVTATPIPTAAPTSGSYTITIQSADTLLVKFPSKVNYNEDDITLSYLLPGSGEEIETDRNFEITWNSAKTEATIEPYIPLSDGDSYLIRFGAKDNGTRFSVSLGIPDEMKITYKSLGKEGVAYAQTTDLVEVPVELGVKLYHKGIDVTSEYLDEATIEFEMVSPEYSDDIQFYGDQLVFYRSNLKAQIRATMYLTDFNGEDHELKSAVTNITSKALGSYTIDKIEEWTIIDDSSTAKINWSSPVHSVVSGTSGKKIVLLFRDTYGIRYSTDDRGVNENNEIYSITDSSQLFGAYEYEIEFNCTADEYLYVDYDGSLEAYAQTNNAPVRITVYSLYEDDYKEKNAGSISVKVLAEPKLTSIQAEKKSISLQTGCLPGYESILCTGKIELELLDQYGDAWEGESYLEISSSNRDVNSALGDSSGPAYVDGTTLYIDAYALRQLTTQKTVSLTIKESEIKKSVSISVSLQDPVLTNGEIVATGWTAGAENVALSFDENESSNVKFAKIYIYQTGRSGVKVGLLPAAGNTVTIKEEKNYKPTAEECHEGDIFVYVTGPDGKIVPKADADDLGIYWDSTAGCLKLNVAAPDSSTTVGFLAAGKYTVYVTMVDKIEGTKVTTTPKKAYVTVTDDIGSLKLEGTRGTRSETYVNGDGDTGSVADIIAELFVFSRNGKEFTVTADMITDVDFTWKERSVIIRSVEITMPVSENSSMSYRKTVKFSNKSVFHGVESN